ncbi:MAG: SIMPL domain-containing protein [Mangrovibacterium sp.]|nr:SIMPL domain-containing protein [Mangrovibacterium sp.]
MTQTGLLYKDNDPATNSARTGTSKSFIVIKNSSIPMASCLIFLFFLLLSSSAQQPANPLESTPYIEVTGEGDIEVVPDEIFLRFTLKERYDGRNKTSLDGLEKKLKQLLVKNNFRIEDLSLADASADYITIKRQKKDVLQSKDFVLKVSTTTELTRLWNILEEVEAQNAYVSRVDHSQMEDLKKEVKIKAVKNAKEKASYLLDAAGEKLGGVLFLQERESYLPVLMTKSQRAVAAFSDESVNAVPDEPEVSYQKIKLNYKVFARFAITE